ncbi:hypothetical protein [Mesorhizobium sp. CN2-181]|uniref:hypothetical protein n=1 Tax=Mesorhizobium yinganensis TaxID=3157707 RepID=UPI0032B7378C
MKITNVQLIQGNSSGAYRFTIETDLQCQVTLQVDVAARGDLGAVEKTVWEKVRNTVTEMANILELRNGTH